MGIHSETYTFRIACCWVSMCLPVSNPQGTYHHARVLYLTSAFSSFPNGSPYCGISGLRKSSSGSMNFSSWLCFDSIGSDGGGIPDSDDIVMTRTRRDTGIHRVRAALTREQNAGNGDVRVKMKCAAAETSLTDGEVGRLIAIPSTLHGTWKRACRHGRLTQMPGIQADLTMGNVVSGISFAMSSPRGQHKRLQIVFIPGNSHATLRIGQR